jgi:4-hydroxy-tetrahydrodipicolinate reductase
MDAIILGDGALGSAIEAALRGRGDAVRTVGRPPGGRHDPATLGGATVVFEASRGDAVAGNLGAALEGGCRQFVIGTTGWDAARSRVEARLRDAGAVAVAASNLSLGAALFLRLVESATELYGPLDAFEPYIVEWHRRGKRDRPSGTALELGRRIVARHPRFHRLPGGSRPAGTTEANASVATRPHDELEIAAVRAGSSPGSHLVGFDATGETVELRLTARDRSAYAVGALAAADWLCGAPRSPGIHPFDAVVDDLISSRPLAATA